MLGNFVRTRRLKELLGLFSGAFAKGVSSFTLFGFVIGIFFLYVLLFDLLIGVGFLLGFCLGHDVFILVEKLIFDRDFSF